VELVLIGLSHHTAPVELRERAAFSAEQARRASAELRAQGILEETLVLSTCNRSELYGVPAERGGGLTSLERYWVDFHALDASVLNGTLYRRSGSEVVRHVFRVAAGLDSLLLGEAEILGQLREAYRAAYELGATGPVLNRMFQAALEVGKRARAETEIGARPVSVAFAGVKLAQQIFGKLKSRSALIVGAGAVSEQVVEHLKDQGIAQLLVANRSRQRADELAQAWGGEVVEWSALARALRLPDMVVASASVHEPLLTPAMLAQAMALRQNRALFLIDLGVPRNISPEAGQLYNVYLFNIDDLGAMVEENKRARAGEIPRVESIIEEHLRKFQSWQAGMEIAAVVRELRTRLGAERARFLAEHPGVSALPPAEREQFDRLAGELIEKLLVARVEGLRGSRELRRQLEELDAIRMLYGLDGDRG
jgi:glutamyl-tRNA reductase